MSLQSLHSNPKYLTLNWCYALVKVKYCVRVSMVFGKIGETSQHMLVLTLLILWVNKFQFALIFDFNAK